MANKRDDEAYEIESVSKSLAVLECLIEEEPVPLKKVAAKTELGRDVVMRTLRTFRIRGYAKQNADGDWIAGPRMVRLAIETKVV